MHPRRRLRMTTAQKCFLLALEGSCNSGRLVPLSWWLGIHRPTGKDLAAVRGLKATPHFLLCSHSSRTKWAQAFIGWWLHIAAIHHGSPYQIFSAHVCLSLPCSLPRHLVLGKITPSLSDSWTLGIFGHGVPGQTHLVSGEVTTTWPLAVRPYCTRDRCAVDILSPLSINRL